MLNRSIVWDTVKQEVRGLEGIPGPSDFSLTNDGRTMVINHAAQESDIWLLTLAE